MQYNILFIYISLSEFIVPYLCIGYLQAIDTLYIQQPTQTHDCTYIYMYIIIYIGKLYRVISRDFLFSCESHCLLVFKIQFTDIL